MDDAFLRNLVAEAAQYLCSLTEGRALSSDRTILRTDSVHEADSIHNSLELIWDVSRSSSAAESMGNMGCAELLWGIAFHSDDDRIQELCLGALANLCLQSVCCCRLLALPGAAVACVALCGPSAGLNSSSGGYVQALRLSRVIIGESASEPQREELLRPFLDANVCDEVVALFPRGHLEFDSELQVALVDLLAYFLQSAQQCHLFALISNNFLRAGVFAAALRASHGVFTDNVRIAQFLLVCQIHAGVIDVYSQCDALDIVSAFAALLANPSWSCSGVAMVRCSCGDLRK